ncbi:MAG: PAS domain S-box protein [Chloroflexi bacterium]|nr:PAS domain S-box protein [Chloroflexota bacterium]
MTLLRKTLLVLIGTVIISTLSIYLASRITLLEGYEKIEQDDTRANVQRVVNSYYDQSRNLDLVGRAYAFWDDMYQFVETPDSVFLDSLGLTPDLFATHRANLVVILDVNYQPLFLEMYDLETMAPLEIPSDLATLLRPGSPLLAHTVEHPEISGVVLLAGKPMYVTSLGSLRTDFSGEPRGAIIFGRYLNGGVLDDLSKVSQLDVSASLLNETFMAEDTRRANEWLFAANSRDAIYVESQGQDVISGYTYVWTLDQHPAFLLKVSMPRTIYRQGLESFGYFAVLAGTSGLAFLLVSILLLQQFVLSPLTTLNQQIGRIRASGDHSQRVKVHGRDEISNLGNTINGMLEAIEKHSEEWIGAIFNSVNDAIFIHALDGRILYVNETAVSMFGYRQEEFVNLNIGMFSAGAYPYTQVEAEEWLRQTQTGQPQLFEWMSKRKDGSLFWSEVNARFAQIGQESLYLVTVRDISERKRAEAEREKFVAELENRNAELERFTYTVSHDLKSPLVTICGFLGYVEKDAIAGDIERLRKDMERITNATDKMQRLLNELLELSRVGRMVNPMEVVPFGEIAREAVALTQGCRQERNIAIEIADGMPSVLGDRVRLVEVVQNLVDNACKFMGEQPHPRIEIGWRKAEVDEIVVYVSDNGIGIAPEHHERVFGLFNQLNPNMEGTGVGLALVKRIIEFHGGKIWIESELGMGATFLFTLPCR